VSCASRSDMDSLRMLWAHSLKVFAGFGPGRCPPFSRGCTTLLALPYIVPYSYWWHKCEMGTDAAAAAQRELDLASASPKRTSGD